MATCSVKRHSKSVGSAAFRSQGPPRNGADYIRCAPLFNGDFGERSRGDNRFLGGFDTTLQFFLDQQLMCYFSRPADNHDWSATA